MTSDGADIASPLRTLRLACLPGVCSAARYRASAPGTTWHRVSAGLGSTCTNRKHALTVLNPPATSLHSPHCGGHDNWHTFARREGHRHDDLCVFGELDPAGRAELQGGY